MSNDITIKLVESDDDLLDIVPLKQADDTEWVGSQISVDSALEKIIGIKGHRSDFWIARHGQNPAGYAIGILDGESYNSERIYVKPEYRGQGIGTLLKQAQIDFARNLGCDEILLNAADVNEASKKVYEKRGLGSEPSMLVISLGQH